MPDENKSLLKNVEKMCSVTSFTDVDEDSKHSIRSYKIRWFILANYATLAFVVCVNSTTHGPINNVLVDYFQVGAWQIDLLTTIRSLLVAFSILPFAILSSRMGYKKTFVFQYGLFTTGVFLSAIGALFRQGYALTLIGQISTGLTSTLLSAQALETAAIWFPANEVSIAIALVTMMRALGRAIGSISTTILVNADMKTQDIKLRLACFYGAMTVLMVAMLISTIVCVDDAPDLPPSHAQAAVVKTKPKIGKEKAMDTIKQSLRLYWDLLKDPQFLITALCISSALAVIRFYTTLLSSILHGTFGKDISLNMKAGYGLMGMSFGTTVGSFIVGPILSEYKNYKAMALLGIGGGCLSCLPSIIGSLFKSLITVEVGVVLQGLFCGFATPALYELLREVTYPKSALQVTAFAVGVTALSIFVWSSLGRILLTNTSVVYAATVPAAILFLSGMLLACKSMTLHRQKAEESGERQELLKSDSEE